MLKHFFAVVNDGKIQLYNSDGTKAIDNKLKSCLGAVINFSPSEQIAQINLSFPLILCADEEQVKFMADSEYNDK